MNQRTDITDQHLFDRAEIILVVDEIDNTVDAKDWERCRGYFTDEIYADFTSLAGGSPANMPADDLVEAWATNLYAHRLSAGQTHGLGLTPSLRTVGLRCSSSDHRWS